MEKLTPITSDIIEALGWETNTYNSTMVTSYIHKKWNLENHKYYVELKPGPDDYYEIYELGENRFVDYECVFSGTLKTEEDLNDIMRMVSIPF